MQVTRYNGACDHASVGPDGTYHSGMARSEDSTAHGHGRSPEHSHGRATTATTPLAAALERVGDRWSPRIVAALLESPLRYGELQAEVAGIAPNILADRLRRLEADGLLTSVAYAERPPRFEYRLTAEGRALAGALRLLADWGAMHAVSAAGDAEHEVLRHEACGSALDARWFCPTCGEVVDLDDPEGTHRL